MIFLGLYLARVIGTKALPKDPGPPVTRMEALSNMLANPAGRGRAAQVSMALSQTGILSSGGAGWALGPRASERASVRREPDADPGIVSPLARRSRVPVKAIPAQ